jgi:hypothetical protein
MIEVLDKPSASQTWLCLKCGQSVERADTWAVNLARGDEDTVCRLCRKSPDGLDYAKNLFGPNRARTLTREAMPFALLLLNRDHQRREGSPMADDAAAKLAKLHFRMCVLLNKTYSQMGDGFELSDDAVIQWLIDLSNDIDPSMMERTKNIKLKKLKLTGSIPLPRE